MKKTNEEKLQEALAKLLDKKLSVTLLCEKADISRGTFYLEELDSPKWETAANQTYSAMDATALSLQSTRTCSPATRK